MNSEPSGRPLSAEEQVAKNREESIFILNDMFERYRDSGQDYFIESGFQVEIRRPGEKEGPSAKIEVDIILRHRPEDLSRVTVHVILSGNVPYAGKAIGTTDIRRSDFSSGCWRIRFGNETFPLRHISLFAVDMRLPSDD